MINRTYINTKPSENPLISIVVPVYNVQEYLSECLDSLINQTYRNLEIILINDGSTDNSSNILNNFAKLDKRIQVIHKRNGGVSTARNVGLKISTGKYIMFVDSDDWIDEEMVDTMVRIAKLKQVDLVSCRMRRVTMNGISREVAYDYHPINHILSKNELYLEIVKELFHGGGTLYCRLIDKSLANSERFIDGMRISEDQEWLLRVANKINKGIYIPNSLYNTRMRPESATTKSKITDVDDIEIVNQQIIAWSNTNKLFGDATIANALFVRSRLQYSTVLRASLNGPLTAQLRKKMIMSYKLSRYISTDEKMKYYISLLPPLMYRSMRVMLKKVRRESV